MKIININNDHLLTHRYGWHKIIFELVQTINTSSKSTLSVNEEIKLCIPDNIKKNRINIKTYHKSKSNIEICSQKYTQQPKIKDHEIIIDTKEKTVYQKNIIKSKSFPNIFLLGNIKLNNKLNALFKYSKNKLTNTNLNVTTSQSYFIEPNNEEYDSLDQKSTISVTNLSEQTNINDISNDDNTSQDEIVNHNEINIEDLLLVDFMDKYFNLWYELPKIITCENKIYNFINKDAYYHINDVEKNDVFIYIDELNLYHILKWYPEYNEFKIMRGEVISYFKKKINSNKINKPWVGILHYPEFCADMNYESYESLPNILKSTTLKDSLINCKCIITLSEYLKEYVLKELNNNYNIPIEVIYHPTDFNCKKFNYNSFINNIDKKIIQIGFWMRKTSTIYKLSIPFKKYWLPGGHYWKNMFSQIYPNYEDYLNDKSVTIKMYLSNEDYDNLLSENIVLLDVFNSSANNTVLECIARNTPIFVSKHPAIIEYLGIDYPMYFETEIDLMEKINNKNFLNLIKLGYNYLLNLDKNIYKIESFIQKFYEIIKK